MKYRDRAIQSIIISVGSVACISLKCQYKYRSIALHISSPIPFSLRHSFPAPRCPAAYASGPWHGAPAAGRRNPPLVPPWVPYEPRQGCRELPRGQAGYKRRRARGLLDTASVLSIYTPRVGSVRQRRPCALNLVSFTREDQ